MTDHIKKPFRLKSFVRRRGRITQGQQEAYDQHGAQFGLTLADGMLDYQQIFKRDAPCILEIGFGSGQSLLEAARLHPSCDFIGIETHQPGIGALLLGVTELALMNLRVFEADAVDVLEQCIPDASLACVQLFFPDPWQKRKHNARRLIQPAFVSQLAKKLKPHGELHLATDWDDYAIHMMKVMSASTEFDNGAGKGAFSARSPMRPIETKFERRALREGRKIYDLQFVKRV